MFCYIVFDNCAILGLLNYLLDLLNYLLDLHIILRFTLRKSINKQLLLVKVHYIAMSPNC